MTKANRAGRFTSAEATSETTWTRRIVHVRKEATERPKEREHGEDPAVERTISIPQTRRDLGAPRSRATSARCDDPTPPAARPPSPSKTGRPVGGSSGRGARSRPAPEPLQARGSPAGSERCRRREGERTLRRRGSLPSAGAPMRAGEEGRRREGRTMKAERVAEIVADGVGLGEQEISQQSAYYQTLPRWTFERPESLWTGEGRGPR